MSEHGVEVAVRVAHVLAMGLMLGGAVVVAALLAMDGRRPPRALLRAYEWTFWGGLGVAVMTGVGNLGAFAGALPGTGSRWGVLLTLKLALLVALAFLGVLRALLALRASAEAEADAPAMMAPRARRALFMAYGATAAVLLLMALLAVVMAHG